MFSKRLFLQAKNANTNLMLSIGANFISGIITVGQAYYLSQIIALVFLKNRALAEVKSQLIILFALSLARTLFVWSGHVTAQWVASHVKNTLRDKITAHIMTLGPNFTRDERSGELINTAVEGIEALDAYFSQYLPQLATAVLVPVTILVFVFPNDILSGVVLLVTAPIIPVFMVLIGSTAEEMTKKQWTSLSRMSAHFLDVLQGLTTLKLLGRSREQIQTIAEISDQFRVTTMSVLRVAFLSALVLEMAATISTAVVAVEIGLRLMYAKIEFPQALFILILAPEFYIPLRMLGTRFHAGMSGITAAKRIFEVLDTPLDAQKTLAAPQRLSSDKISIAFENVHYAYAEGDRPALTGVSFDIDTDETVALVGPSGAGKSTVAHLLLRFIDAQQGNIRVNGQLLTTLDMAAWRNHIAWVPQNPYLFDASIAENIKLARPDATIAEVENAARLAHALPFIHALPNQFETAIGERGARLSGGQAQRIALARAFLKDAPFLILDEATANLDPQHEADIQSVIEKLTQNRTVLLIAHRLNTITRADKILVLEKGMLAESGTHAELLHQAGLYRRLISAYQGGRV